MQSSDRTISKHSIISNYIYNISYQLLILILPLITTPYISKILGPDGVGMYGLTNSISQYFVLFGCVGLNLYGQKEIAYHQNNVYERSKIFYELLFIRFCAMFFSICIFMCTVCNIEKYSILFRIEIFELVAALIDITWFYQGLEEFKTIVIRNSIVKVSGVVCIFSFVKTPLDTPIYTTILVMTVLLGNLSLWFYLPRYIQKLNKKALNIRKHVIPALTLFVPQIATSIYNILDKSMIGLITGNDAEVAYYEQAQKIIKMALAIPSAVGTVMLPRVANMYGEGNTQKIINYIHTSMKFVCMLTFPLCFGIIGIAKDFVPWFFGIEFAKVYDNFLVISPVIIFVGISNVLGVQYLLAINRHKDYSKSVLTGTLINFIFNIILIPSLMSIGAAIASIIAEISVTLTQIFILRKEISIKNIVLNIYKYLIGAVLMFVIIILYSNFIATKKPLDTVIEIILGIMVYGIFLLCIKDKLVIEQLKKILKHKKIIR